jgi:hypothetical protein
MQQLSPAQSMGAMPMGWNCAQLVPIGIVAVVEPDGGQQSIDGWLPHSRCAQALSARTG